MPDPRQLGGGASAPHHEAGAKADTPPQKVTTQKVTTKLMLVDDSLVIRSIIEQMISQDAGFEIVASVDNGQKAVNFLRDNRADVIILDIEMPVMDGLAALPEILAVAKDARILILSSNGEAGGAAAIKALSLGASDTLAKPGRTNFGGKFSDILLERLHRLGASQHALSKDSHYVQALPDHDTVRQIAIPQQRLEAVAIGASTGGITAAITFISRLAANFTGPIFFTQHLPEAFIPFFAGQLGQSTGRRVEVAVDGQKIAQNTIYLAPGEGHLTVIREGQRSGQKCAAIKITRETVSSGCKPSTDPMFASISEIYGASACAVLLSGMGNDGLVGARILAKEGASILAQSPESCVVWGMPGSVVRDGIASAIMEPEEMADFVNQWANQDTNQGVNQLAGNKRVGNGHA